MTDNYTVERIAPDLSVGCPGHTNVSNASYLALAGVTGKHESTTVVRCKCCGDIKWTAHVFSKSEKTGTLSSGHKIHVGEPVVGGTKPPKN